jgi:hypothetical protein
VFAYGSLSIGRADPWRWVMWCAESGERDFNLCVYVVQGRRVRGRITSTSAGTSRCLPAQALWSLRRMSTVRLLVLFSARSRL